MNAKQLIKLLEEMAGLKSEAVVVTAYSSMQIINIQYQ